MFYVALFLCQKKIITQSISVNSFMSRANLSLDKHNPVYNEQYASHLKFNKGDVVLDIATGFEVRYASKLNDVKKFISLEPFVPWHTQLVEAAPALPCQSEFLNCTYEEYIPEDKIDVVVSAGLIYHLASPMHFLETVVNVYAPRVFYLETTGIYANDHTDEETEAHFVKESINTAGMRQGKRVIPWRLNINNNSFIVTAMRSVGYSLETFADLSTEMVSKTKVTFFKFSRIE
jgi:hypothetical protein